MFPVSKRKIMPPSVVLDSLTISEINYQYELESVTRSSKRIKQCYVLLGTVINTTEAETVTVKGCIRVPLKADDTVVDVELLKKRYDLAKIVDPDNSTLLGLLVIFAGHFDYSSVVNGLINCLLPATFHEKLYRPCLLFHYEPYTRINGDEDDFQDTAQEASEEGLQLFCYIADHQTIQDYSRINFTITSDPSNIVIREGQITGFTDSKPGITEGEANIDNESSYPPLESIVSSRNVARNKLRGKLNSRISQMLRFLKNDNYFTTTVDKDIGERRDVILRRISMLVSRLEKGPTSDIEVEIARTENELKVLEIACEQWEISNKPLL